jgi:hypothetical protein
MAEQNTKLKYQALHDWAKECGVTFTAIKYEGVVLDPSISGVWIYLEALPTWLPRPEDMSPVADEPPRLHLQFLPMKRSDGLRITLLAGIDGDGILHYCDVEYRERQRP